MSLLPDHLAVGHVFAEILADPAPDDLPEPPVILLDLLDVAAGPVHGYSLADPLAKMLATNDSTSEAQMSQYP